MSKRNIALEWAQEIFIIVNYGQLASHVDCVILHNASILIMDQALTVASCFI